MKNNKLFSVLLALLVCLSMVVSASATSESDLSFTLESDSSVEALGNAVVGAGETFTVTVNIEKNPGVLAAIVYAEYDSNVLELVSAKAVAENVKANPLNGRVHIVVGNTDAIFTPDKFEPVATTGAVAELTFKVLAETDVQTAVTLEANQSNVCDANGKFECTVSGAALNVNVVGAEHVCDTTKTTDAKNGVDPTCTEAGKKSDLRCSHCGKVVTEGEVIPATDHNWGEGEITKQPGCATMGERTYTCANCGETQVDASVPATGEHTYGDWTVKTEATVDAEGVEARTCSECGAEETRSIPKLDPPAEPVEPEPKNNTLVIVIVVLVVLAGAGVAAYFVLKNKKK